VSLAVRATPHRLPLSSDLAILGGDLRELRAPSAARRLRLGVSEVPDQAVGVQFTDQERHLATTRRGSRASVDIRTGTYVDDCMLAPVVRVALQTGMPSRPRTPRD
jgi:hypothetical protein